MSILATNLDQPWHPSGRLCNGAGAIAKEERGFSTMEDQCSTERALKRPIAHCEPLAVRRMRSGVAGGCRIDSAYSAMHYSGGGRRGSSL